MIRVFTTTAVCLAIVALFAPTLRAAQPFDIGLAASGARIDAVAVDSRDREAPTVVLIGGLRGDDASAAAVRSAVKAYEKRRARPVNLLAIPLANPASASLTFPPSGIAYRENAESNALWRWIGAHAPDLVLVAGDDAGLAAALSANVVADMGRIAARAWNANDDLARLGPLPKSAARLELDRRRARSPRQLAEALGKVYGRDFEQPWYIGAIALNARSALGDVADVRRLAEPYVDGTKDPLARVNALVMAGQIVFTDLARRTGDPRYVAAVRRVADLGFDADGNPRESMPYHDQYSDSVFMGTTIVAQAGSLTADPKYFDMADRHLRFMQQLVLRKDGLYRHRAGLDAAWGRGNGFAALGLALTLSEIPGDHPTHAHVLESYRSLMKALLPYQNRDGLWRNVVDHPGTYAEFSGTAMIGFALRRGLDRGWIKGKDYARAVDAAWLAVNSRSSNSGSFIDVCESTALMKSDDDYLKRAALLGNDPRGGAMALLFATELYSRAQ